MAENAKSIYLGDVIHPTWITYILGTTVFFLYLLMIMGTFVTSTGSGLACPDWPLCYGTVRPPLKLHIWFEWGHRLLGGLTGLLIGTSTLLVWSRFKGVTRFLTGVVTGLLLFGVLIGGMTVLIEAPYLDNFFRIATVSSHLIIATLVLISLVFVLRRVIGGRKVLDRGYYFFLFCMVYLQVILGILVRYSKASLACPDFPLCQGRLFPPLSSYTVMLHYSHRVVALSVVGLAVGLLYRAIRRGLQIRTPLITLSIVLLQASFGAMVVLTGMFLPVIILHGATGFLLLGWLAYQSAPFLFQYVRGIALEPRGGR